GSVDEPPSELFFFSASTLVLSTTPGEDVIALHQPRHPRIRDLLDALPSESYSLVELGEFGFRVRVLG
ncbi:MAG: hypothetical protein KC766_05905, partial [Myxococcales bacterium]|nr:hypothetical protein [Myxococcales bacterium]